MQLLSYFWGSSSPPLTVEEEVRNYVTSCEAAESFVLRLEKGSDTPEDRLMSLFGCLQKILGRKSNERYQVLHRAVKARLIRQYKLSPTVHKLIKCLTATPQNVACRLRLGNLYKATNPKKCIAQDDKQVKYHLELVYRDHADDPVVLASYGDYLRASDAPEAAEVLKRASDILAGTSDSDPQIDKKVCLSSFVYANRANLALCKNDRENALRYLGLAMRCRPLHPFVKDVWHHFTRKGIDAGNFPVDHPNGFKFDPLCKIIPAHYPVKE